MNIFDFFFGELPKGISKKDIETLSERQNTPKWLTSFVLRDYKPIVDKAVGELVEEQEKFERLHKEAHRRMKESK